MANSRYTSLALIASLVLNCVLVVLLARDWVQHRRTALGNVSTANALKSIVSTSLLPSVRFEVLLAESEPTPGAVPYRVANTAETFYAVGSPVLTNGDIESASVSRGTIGEPALRLVFTPEGARKLADVTAVNVSKRLLFVAEGEVLMAPVIMGAITDTETIVTGSFSEEELRRIVFALARS